MEWQEIVVEVVIVISLTFLVTARTPSVIAEHNPRKVHLNFRRPESSFPSWLEGSNQIIKLGPLFIVNFEGKVLNVGEELWRETLPLRMGSQLYQLQGLKSLNWYEVKISYPASIPATFSLQLKKGKGNLDLGLNQNRKLLNTEKLIFKTDNLDVLNNQGGMYVLVTVEPEGIVAIPHVQEREFIVFNIVCDELLLGIPRYSWWVVVLVLLCLGLALVTPYFLPSYLLPKNRRLPLEMQNVSKDS